MINGGIPDTLTHFLEEIVLKDKKENLKQLMQLKLHCNAITTAVRPRSFLS